MPQSQQHEQHGTGTLEHEQETGQQNQEYNQPAARRSGGQGEVRRDNDGRLRDNLTPEQRSAIGRKGGEAVSRNREHMSSIGRKGGEAVSRDRQHMASIGQKGGRS